MAMFRTNVPRQRQSALVASCELLAERLWHLPNAIRPSGTWPGAPGADMAIFVPTPAVPDRQVPTSTFCNRRIQIIGRFGNWTNAADWRPAALTSGAFSEELPTLQTVEVSVPWMTMPIADGWQSPLRHRYS